MVFIAQSDSNEDSEGRQLRVNKKLSKAISSVPRSRFQKPRPNLPGSKRSDSRSTPASACKSVIETSQNKDDRSTVVLKTEETAQNGDKIEVAVSNTEKAIENVYSVLSTDEAIDKENNKTLLIKDENPEVSKSNTLILNIFESVQVKDITVPSILNTNESVQEEALTVSSILTETEAVQVEDITVSSNLNAIESIQEEDVAVSSILNANESVQVEDITVSSIGNANEICQEGDTIPIVITQAANAVGNLPEQNKNDTINISSNATDRSSKYPHLTSILSKKRIEPKKEVQHKKRKKFKKGDGPPDRSKMTVADLIYWNPTKSNESVKNSENVNAEADAMIAITNSENINIEADPINNEEECVDGDIAEDNIYDSVPKLVLSEDGQINIDQTSLIISRNIPQVTHTEVVRREEATYSSFRKRPLTKHWSVKDTTIFYKALSLVGTDFGLMEKIFPHRTRRELKQKFKREEKFNIDLINRAMYESQLTFDAETLEDLIENLNNLSDDNSENAGDSETPAKKRTSNKKQKSAKKSKSVHEFSDSATESALNESNQFAHELSDPAIESVPIENNNSASELSNSVTDSVPNKDVCNIRKKRQRKVKNLPEGFVAIDDIENTLDLVAEETISSEPNLKKGGKKRNQDTVSFSPQELCLEETVNTDINSTSVSDDQMECIPIQYIENISSVTETTLMSNVMAYEVVCCEAPVTKKSHKLNVSKNNQTFLPLLLSPANYTPT